MPRARRRTDIVASVPELTSRTISTGVRSTIAAARSTSASVGAPYDVPVLSGLGDRPEHLRVRVPEQHRAPRADEVDQLVAVQVVEVRPLGPGDEPRGSADREEGADGEFTPPGMTSRARANAVADLVSVIVSVIAAFPGAVPTRGPSR